MSDQVQPLVDHAPLAFTVPTLVLQRVRQTDLATFGRLTSEQATLGVVSPVQCVTLELAWRDNQPNVSCVPAGTYPIVRRWSAHFGRELFELEQVPGRSACEIHVANTVGDLRGCIGVGRAFGRVNGQDGIVESAAALAGFMGAMRGVDRATLTIRDVPGGPSTIATYHPARLDTESIAARTGETP